MVVNNEVLTIASLSRIYLDQQELEGLTEDLESILNYVKKLQKLNLEKVKPTSHVLPLKNVYREDVTRPSLTQEQALSFAIAKHNGSFKVPQVIE